MTDPTRSIDVSVEVAGTPEEVWETIATGPGISSWFIGMTLDEREGGAVTFSWGSYGDETGQVTAWEPPHRIAYNGGAERPLAYEWLVEARDGASCVVRLVNSGFGHGEDWDEQYDGMSKGWPIFLENLRLQRAHLAGERARASSIATAMVPGPGPSAWAALCDAIGIPTDLAPGDAFATSGDGVPELRGTVASVTDVPAARACFVVVDAPARGTAFVAAEGDGEVVACSVYTYLVGDHPDVWTPFVEARWPAPEVSPIS